jgi:hypothetical protein
VTVIARYRDAKEGKLEVYRLDDGALQVITIRGSKRGVSDVKRNPASSALVELDLVLRGLGWERYYFEPTLSGLSSEEEKRRAWNDSLAKEMTKAEADQWAGLPRAKKY